MCAFITWFVFLLIPEEFISTWSVQLIQGSNKLTDTSFLQAIGAWSIQPSLFTIFCTPSVYTPHSSLWTFCACLYTESLALPWIYLVFAFFFYLIRCYHISSISYHNNFIVQLFKWQKTGLPDMLGGSCYLVKTQSNKKHTQRQEP